MGRNKNGRRLRKKRKLNPTYSIIVDGETEIWYLQMLKQFENIKEVRIIPELPNKRKLEQQYNYVLERFDTYDKVIWIVDLDVIIKEGKNQGNLNSRISSFKKMKDNVESLDGIVIVNTPCLEEWILLHFEYSTKYYQNCASVIEKLKKHSKYYEKYYKKCNNDIYTILRDKLDVALLNSRSLGEVDFNNIESAKSEMFKLFDFLKID